MSDSVVARVADRLEIQPEQTDRVLRTLAQLIKKQSAREGRVRVPGLGVFEQSAEALVFEPDAALAEAVNVRYASLETVPLALSPEAELEAPEAETEEAPMKAPGAAVEESAAPPEDVVEDVAEETAPDEAVEEPAEAEEEAASFFEEEPAAKEELAEDEEDSFFEDEPVAEEEPAVAEAESEEEDSFFEDKPVAEEELVEDEQEEAATADLAEEALPLYNAPAEPADFDDPDVSEAAAYEQLEEEAGETAEATHPDMAPPGSTWSKEDLEALLQESAEEETAEEEAAVAETDALIEEAEEEIKEEVEEAEAVLAGGDEDRPPQPAQEEPRRRSMLPWIFVAAAVIVIGAGVLWQLGFFGPSAPDPTPPVATDTPPVVTPPPTEETPAPAEETPAPTEETPAPTEETPAATPPASGRIDRSVGGYTLIAASLPQSAAEAEAERYRQLFSSQSIPADVLRGESGGRVRYRVAIGQVPTIEEAKALLSRLASDLPDGTWVTRITPDS